MRIIQDPVEGWSDFSSLKAFLERKYGSANVTMIRSIRTQTGTDGAVDLSEKGGLTISQKAKTEATLVLAASANNNDYDGESVTIYYKSSDGTKASATAAFNTTDSTTEAAFSVTDFYCFNTEDYGQQACVSTVAAAAGEYFYIGTTGLGANAELRYAIIEPADTYPDADNFFGIGRLFAAGEADNASDRSLVFTLEYMTPWGSIRDGTFTLDASDSTTIVRVFDTDGNAVNDFYHLRDMYTTQATTGGYVAIAHDADKMVGTVALDTFYGVVEQAYSYSDTTKYMVPANKRAFYGYVCGSARTNTYITFTSTFTPKDFAMAVTPSIVFGQDETTSRHEVCLELEPLSFASFTILGNSAVFCGDICMIEVDTT